MSQMSILSVVLPIYALNMLSATLKRSTFNAIVDFPFSGRIRVVEVTSNLPSLKRTNVDDEFALPFGEIDCCVHTRGNRGY